MKILIIDDDRSLQETAKDLIAEINPAIETAVMPDTGDAISFIGLFNPDILLLDNTASRTDSLHLLKMIRDISSFDNIHIIMLTDSENRENLNKCFLYGADDYASKPINKLEFAARIQAASKNRLYASYLEESNKKLAEQHQEVATLYKKLQDTQFHIVQKEKMASVGELAAGIAHEINNPISYVSSNLQTTAYYMKKVFFESTLADTEKEKYIQEILNMLDESQDGIDRISRIVSSLKLFARTGYEDIEKEVIDLNLLASEATFILKPRAERNQISMTHCKDHSSFVWGNHYDIGQVLLSIMSNSIDALEKTNADEKKIRITNFNEKDFSCIRIADNGIGIAKELRPRIFDPFFSTKEIGSGIGLGLSISYEIITHKHNGQLLLEDSNPYFATGTSFLIRIPAGEAVPTDKLACRTLT